MKISKFNHEGYHDPTPYLAFLNIPDPAKEAKKEKERRDRLARYRPLVYICSPYAGDVKANVLNTRRYMPAIAASNKVILFGDLGYYWVADREGRSFKRLNELYAATGQVGFQSSERVDGKLVLAEAVKVLAMKAS